MLLRPILIHVNPANGRHSLNSGSDPGSVQLPQSPHHQSQGSQKWWLPSQCNLFLSVAQRECLGLSGCSSFLDILSALWVMCQHLATFSKSSRLEYPLYPEPFGDKKDLWERLQGCFVLPPRQAGRIVKRHGVQRCEMPPHYRWCRGNLGLHLRRSDPGSPALWEL